MPDYPARAMTARGSDGMDCALKAIEYVTFAGLDDLKRLVVFVSTDFALCHDRVLDRMLQLFLSTSF
jgi:hypothetical protein